MKQSKRLVALLLSLLLMLSLLSASALAAEAGDVVTRKDFVIKLYQHPAFGLSGRISGNAAAFNDLDGCTGEERNAFGVLRDAGIFMGGADGSAHPADSLLRIEAVMFIWRAAGGAVSGESGVLPYADIPESSPFYDAVNSLYAKGVLTNADMDESRNFCPNDPVTAAAADMWLGAFIETGSGSIPDAPDSGMAPEELAAELKRLGLFQGVSDTEFDLDRAPTRVEAVIMLIRALGQEQAALSGSWSHSFEDVPAWADAYIGYAYENRLANGHSDTEFGSEDANAAMYLTFVLRALGYSDADGDFVWTEPYALATQTGILPLSVNLDTFWRADLVRVSAAALSAKRKGSEQILAEKLIADGVFTREQYAASPLSALTETNTGDNTGTGTGANAGTNANPPTVTSPSKGTNAGTPTGQLVTNPVKVGDMTLYECFRDDGKAKPIVIAIHGGGGSKDDTLPDAQAYAEQGFFALAIDAAACGGNTSGPLDAVKCWATTVTQIDDVLDYYATIPQADAKRFALTGGSMGGTICFAYVAHGKHTPAIIAPSKGSPDHTQIYDGPLYDRFGQAPESSFMTREEIRAFAAEYSPVQYPEKFLDVYVYSGIGTKDETANPDGIRKLENALRELGGTKFVFRYYEGLGHVDDLPDFDPHHAIGQILLGDTNGPIFK